MGRMVTSAQAGEGRYGAYSRAEPHAKSALDQTACTLIYYVCWEYPGTLGPHVACIDITVSPQSAYLLPCYPYRPEKVAPPRIQAGTCADASPHPSCVGPRLRLISYVHLVYQCLHRFPSCLSRTEVAEVGLDCVSQSMPSQVSILLITH